MKLCFILFKKLFSSLSDSEWFVFQFFPLYIDLDNSFYACLVFDMCICIILLSWHFSLKVTISHMIVVFQKHSTNFANFTFTWPFLGGFSHKEAIFVSESPKIRSNSQKQSESFAILLSLFAEELTICEKVVFTFYLGKVYRNTCYQFSFFLVG